MNKKEIEKNFKLSSQFNEYVIKNPEVVKGISSTACIVMGSSRDPKLNQNNKELAKKIIKNENKKCYQAIRLNGKWKIEPIKK